MPRHTDRVKKRVSIINDAKLKMGRFKLALDELGYFSKIEKDAVEAVEATNRSRKAILAQNRALETQYRNKQISKRDFNAQKKENYKALRELASEKRRMIRIDRSTHPDIKKSRRQFRDSFKTFRKLLRL
tara:strand:+ start:70 stop:459 length:390 start_codon:yes stop_codon:yes gene_type:complete